MAKSNDEYDKIEMVDKEGNVSGHLDKDTVVVDGKEVPYDKAYADAYEQDNN